MTRTLTLPYGNSFLEISFNDELTIDLYLPTELKSKEQKSISFDLAIRNPVNNWRFPPNISQNSTVAIAINDKTRPAPNNRLFPPLLEELFQLGVKRENILIIIAVGTHIPMPETEFSILLNEDILHVFFGKSQDVLKVA